MILVCLALFRLGTRAAVASLLSDFMISAQEGITRHWLLGINFQCSAGHDYAPNLSLRPILFQISQKHMLRLDGVCDLTGQSLPRAEQMSSESLRLRAREKIGPVKSRTRLDVLRTLAH
jgi:hypothetical protein